MKCYIPPMRIPVVTPLLCAALTAGVIMSACGCESLPSDPTKATRPYPFQLTQRIAEGIQVFNDGEAMIIVNASVESWTEIDIWLNQRYLHHAKQLAAGETLTIPLNEFWDVRGEGPFPGGLLRYYPPTPIRLTQIQTAPDAPLIGLVSIPTERELDLAQLNKPM